MDEGLHRRHAPFAGGRDDLLPLRDLVVYPRMVAPIFVGREPSILAIEDAQIDNHTLIALTQRDPNQENPGLEDFLPMGVEMAIGRLLSMPDGSSSALAQARRRVELVEFVQEEPFIIARARPIYEPAEVDRQTEPPCVQPSSFCSVVFS